VHSSTLVTARVYLLISFSPSFSYWLNVILLLVSGLTMLIAGVRANSEFDLKRTIALSTLRQLGLMIMTISIGLSSLVFFHLLTHALFKALFFICCWGCGGVIHSIGDSQSICFIGGLSVYILLLPLVTWCTVFLNMFIAPLYMFRATMCPSSGENTVSMRYLLFVTLYG
jgi:NADH-ubiquinone oxidoreductase chain 5